MIKKLSIFSLLILGALFIKAQKDFNETLNIKFYSAKQKTFNVTVNNRSNLIKLSTEKIIYAADSINDNPSFSKMDSSKVSLIDKFISTNDNFYKITDSKIRIRLFNIIKKLNTCSKNINNTDNGLVYLTYNQDHINDKKYCQYTYNKLEENPNDKLMQSFLDEIEKLFADNSLAKTYLNSTKVYFQNSSLKVVSLNPLYVKLYNLPPYHYPRYTSCEKLDEQIQNLPKSEDIFIDITEFQGNYNKCVKELFYKKYKHLNWIQNNMFDIFNSIENKK